MARTRWPPGPVNPGLLPRPGRSDRQRRWVPKLGPADRSFAGQPETASADSEVRPDPGPTLRPHHRKTTEAGPGALSILPAESVLVTCGSQVRQLARIFAGYARSSGAIGVTRGRERDLSVWLGLGTVEARSVRRVWQCCGGPQRGCWRWRSLGFCSPDCGAVPKTRARDLHSRRQPRCAVAESARI